MKSTFLAALLAFFAGVILSGCGGEYTGVEADPNPEEGEKFAEDYAKEMEKEMESQMGGGKK